MTTLKEIRKYLANIEAINFGGCAIAALAMKRWIRDNEKRDVEIVYGYEKKGRVTSTNKKLARGDYNFACPHSFIKYDDKFLDSEKLITNREYKHRIIMDENAVVNSIHSGNWNNWFDRSNIAYIESGLKIDLGDIK